MHVTARARVGIARVHALCALAKVSQPVTKRGLTQMDRDSPVPLRKRLQRVVAILRGYDSRAIGEPGQPVTSVKLPQPERVESEVGTRPRVPQRPLAAVLALISDLVRRPGRVDRRLPLIWLSGRKGSTQVLDTLEKRLKSSSRYRVPYARVTATREGGSGDVRPLLHTLCRNLAAPRFGGERLWFRHYELVEWLMGKNLSELGAGDPPTKITRLLRDRHRQSRGATDRANGTDVVDQGAGSVFEAGYRLLVWLIWRAAPDVLFRAAVSRRIPGVGRRYRWFMRQQYLAPLQSVNFLGFAERLTEGVRQAENSEQVDKLLVHAFLEDLRRAYARRSWRIEGWRRTVYPVVLIDDAAPDTDHYRLLQLINDVRNETGRGDPLLVVCTGDQVPPQVSAEATGGRVVGLADVESEERKIRDDDPVYDDPVYKEWAGALPGSRRARVRTAWYLPISVIDPDEAEQVDERSIYPPRPPWFARRAVVVVIVLAFVASVIGWAGWQLGGPNCLHRPTPGHVSVRSVGGQCIGYSDSSSFRFNDEAGQERLRDVQNKIFQQNKAVRAIWESSNRRRPYVTIVYLGSLTGRPATETEEAYAAEREELEGLAVAQYDGMQDAATLYGSALLHIVIANGGYQMRYASEAVDIIADLAGRDPTVVAVVGLVESRGSTAKALRKLNQIGLPAIAPTLSADEFYENSGLYLQLSPPNIDQARMLAEYATQELKVSDARIYWTVGEESTFEEDLYVKTLVTDLTEVLPNEFGVQVEYSEHFTGFLPDQECGYEGMLLFAGRWTEFASFMEELEGCGSNQPRHLVADDSVNRYMANPTLRNSAPGNLPLTYVSKSTLGACEYLRAVQNQAGGDEVRGRFLRWIQEPNLLTPPRCDGGESNEPVGERVALAYDSAMLPLQAVESLVERLRLDQQQEWDPRSITPILVHAEMLRQNALKPFTGVSGSIMFEPNSGEPIEKRISLLRVNSIPDLTVQPVEVYHCGIVQAGDSAGCRRP